MNTDSSTTAVLIAKLCLLIPATDKSMVAVEYKNTEFATTAIKDDPVFVDESALTHKYVGPALAVALNEIGEGAGEARKSSRGKISVPIGNLGAGKILSPNRTVFESKSVILVTSEKSGRG